MDLRLIKIRLPTRLESGLELDLDEYGVLDYWREVASKDQFAVNIIVPRDRTETIVSELEDKFSHIEDYRLVIQSVEAIVPRPEIEELDNDKGESDEEGESGGESNDNEPSPPVNIEELYGDLADSSTNLPIFIVMSALSAIVAAVGIVRGDIAIIIAGMIIAPLLQPNMSLALATTLGDMNLLFQSMKRNFIGISTVWIVAIVFGVLYPLEPGIEQIAMRTKLGLLEILLAVCAGAAGALSYTSGALGGIVGVMVAVALVPPAVVFGMLAGGNYWYEALGAFLLVSVNVISLNLSGVVTFFLQNVRPRNAWESEKAKSAFWKALLFWVLLLGILAAIIFFGGEYRRYP